MVINVDPRVEAFPEKWASSDGSLTKEAINYLEGSERWKEQIYQALGGSTGESELDDPIDLFSRQPFVASEQEPALIMSNFALQTAVAQRDQVIPVTADYTTTGSAILICANTASITITLNAYPVDGEKYTVKRTNKSITVDGGGNNIDGESAKSITRMYDAPTLIYTMSAGEWSII